jgi:hypothetical protein
MHRVQARRAFVFIVAYVACGAVPARAQETAPAAAVRFAPGFGAAGGIFGDDDPRSVSGVGASVGLQVRARPDRRTGASLEIAFEPFGIGNPHFDETLRTIYVLAGAEIGRHWYVRPAGGIGFQLWSGLFAESGISTALAMSVAVGRRLERDRVDVGIEAVGRTSFSLGALSWTLGVQVPMSW